MSSYSIVMFVHLPSYYNTNNHYKACPFSHYSIKILVLSHKNYTHLLAIMVLNITIWTAKHKHHCFEGEKEEEASFGISINISKWNGGPFCFILFYFEYISTVEGVALLSKYVIL